jgi:hypothetical protein
VEDSKVLYKVVLSFECILASIDGAFVAWIFRDDVLLSA